MTTRKKAATIILPAAILVLILIYSGGVRREKPPNLLLITLDTVRADRLGCYGNMSVSTPAVDHLAEEGILFTDAIAPAPVTLPSHVTVLTGLYPNVHGVRDNSKYRLSKRATTLAEMLRDFGYRTGAVVGAFVLDSRYGLEQGFSFYDDDLSEGSDRSMILHADEENHSRRVRMTKISERNARSVTDRVLTWLSLNDESPFFLWIHYYDPHFPYNPPEPYATEYDDDPYDGEIAFVDEQVGRVLDELQSRAMLDRTLIVVAADHGESLGDHGEKTHGFFIYESAVRVPLIIRYPSRIPAGKRIDATVSLADIVPSVLGIMDIEYDTSFDGVDLTKLMQAGEADEVKEGTGRGIYCESMVPFLTYGWSEIVGLRTGRWKYIRAPRPELYDIVRDPAENRNVLDQYPDTVNVLDRRLDRMIEKGQSTDRSLHEEALLSQEDRERLLSLGYVIGTPTVGKAGPRKDPKDMIEFHEMITEGERAFQEGEFDKALSVLSAVLEADSTNAFVLNMIGAILYRRGDTVAARDYFLRAIEYGQAFATPYRNMANLCYHSKDYRRALTYYEKAIELDPLEQEYYIAIAGIQELLGDDRSAERSFSRARELGDPSPRLLISHGQVLARLGMTGEARRSYEFALETDPAFAPALVELGNLEAAQGDAEKALSDYVRALELNPRFTTARFNLARILMRSGRTGQAMQELQTVVQTDPEHAGSHFLMAELYRQRGEIPEARRHYELVLESSSANEMLKRQAKLSLSELE